MRKFDPTENFDYDPDDPPPEESDIDTWWGQFNRWCETMMRCARLFGLL